MNSDKIKKYWILLSILLLSIFAFDAINNLLDSSNLKSEKIELEEEERSELKEREFEEFYIFHFHHDLYGSFVSLYSFISNDYSANNELVFPFHGQKLYLFLLRLKSHLV